MKASVIQLNKFLQKQDTQFIIPIYQRNYDWDESHCKQLFDDIVEIGSAPKEENKMHFIGSIVYVCNDEYTTDEIEKFVVIDGQQRITTVTLLLIALYQLAIELGDSRLAETILEYYLINKNAESDEFKVKLKATENNDRDLRSLLNHETIPASNYSNIKNNFNFFKKNINRDNRNIVFEGFKRLLFVEIRLERGKDNAQKIFESLNSTGLDLSQADLIRNYILMDLEPVEQNRLYSQYWATIENLTKIEGTSYVSDFIRDYLTIIKGEIPNKDCVFATFKRQYPLNNSTSIEPVLQELLKYALIYNKLLAPGSIEDKEIKQAIEYIKFVEINVAYPFLLQIIDDFKHGVISKNTLLNVLQFVQTYVCRRFILDLPTNALNKVFMILYRQINKNDYENSLYYYIMSRSGKVRMPSDSEIRNYLADKDLYNAKSKMKMYILERLENHNNNEKVSIINNKDITIEHIFPQNPDAKWERLLSEKDYTVFKEQYLDTIGNLTFSGNNGSLGNKVFLEKKLMNKDGKEQGYVYSRLWLNRFLAEIDEWNIENYKKRTDLLVTRFINVWPLPLVEGIKETPELNIFDIDDPTNMEIEYAVFFGTRIDENKFSKLYRFVIKELYQAETEGFVEICRDIIQLSENKDELRRPCSLNSTFYYELNLSALTIVRNLKLILERLDLTDELFIKFRGNV